MSTIRLLRIVNFRGIKEFVWCPEPGLNCLIGPGDSCKSTILSAIDLVLTARRSVTFTDADFHEMNVTQPIEIEATIGNLDEDFLNYDRYGSFLRGFKLATKELFDEPETGLETVLTMKLTVNQDLQPEWGLFSIRAEAEQIERSLTWGQRERVSPIKLDGYSDRHLAWGTYSLLNKMMGNTPDVSATLANIARQSRENFQPQPNNVFDGVLAQVQQIANRQGIRVQGLKAQLDVKGVSLSNGAIALHNADNTPLKQLGTGSTRLLVSGIQRATSTSTILLVDEAELGLEPFRISRLLSELGSRDQDPVKQVFITTHSPHVVKELLPGQLFILRKSLEPFPPPAVGRLNVVHRLYPIPVNDQAGKLIRKCADALFANAVIVCEGITEVGLVNGIDHYKATQRQSTYQEKGAVCIDGGGDHMFERAAFFKSLGFPTAIFKDSDKAQEHAAHQAQMAAQHIAVVEWSGGQATENILFAACPLTQGQELVNLAILNKSEPTINNHLHQNSGGTLNSAVCSQSFSNEMRGQVGAISKDKNWFKDESTAEEVGFSVVAPHLQQFGMPFQQVLGQLNTWVEQNT